MGVTLRNECEFRSAPVENTQCQALPRPGLCSILAIGATVLLDSGHAYSPANACSARPRQLAAGYAPAPAPLGALNYSAPRGATKIRIEFCPG
jgi:hypothetical protein